MTSNGIWLRPTLQLDVHHPKVHFTGLRLTQSHQSVARRVGSIRDFIRRMPFRASQDRGSISASEVLDQRAGDCHTKGLLFTAAQGRDLATRPDCRVQWDCASDAIRHFRPEDVLHDYGAFDDVAQFHRTEGAAPGWLSRVKYSLEAHGVNQRVDALRRVLASTQDDKTPLAG